MKKLIMTVFSFLWAISAIGAGGISSGGGGTIPGKALNPYNVVRVMMQSKRDLRLTLNYMSYLYDPGSAHNQPYKSKIFDGPITIMDLVESTNIEMRDSDSCYDANNKPVDGSIYANSPNAICISAFSTAPKLIKERARKEIIALIAHELGHLLGLDEEEARSLQQDILTHLDESNDNSGKQYLELNEELASRIYVAFDRIKSSVTELNFDQIRQALKEIRWYDFREVHSLLDYSVFNQKDWNYYLIEQERIFLLNAYVNGMSSQNDAVYWKEKYDSYFKNKKTVTMAELHNLKSSSPYDGPYGGYTFSKLESINDLKLELSNSEKYYSSLYSYLYDLKINKSLTVLPNPKKDQQPNPFQTFKGQFDVSREQCTENGKPVEKSGITAFEFFKDIDGKLKMKRHWVNAWAIDGVYDNAGDTLAGSIVSVEGTLSSAKRIANFGNLWGDHWQYKTLEIFRDQNGVHVKQSWDTQRRDSYEGTTTHYKKECLFEGTFLEEL